jgi:hypothetical protein
VKAISFVPNDVGKNVLHGSILYWIDGDNSGDSIRYRIRWDAIQNRSESSQNPMIRQKSDRNPGDDPTDGSVVLDPIKYAVFW